MVPVASMRRRLVLNNRWAVLGMLFFARTTMGFQFQSIGSVSDHLVADLGIRYADVGFLIGLFMLPGVFLAMPGGIVTKWLGDTRTSAIGLSMMAIGGLLVATGLGYQVAALGRGLTGCGAVLLNLTLTKMVIDWFGKRDTFTAMGIFLASWPCGIGLALVGLTAMANAFGWQYALLVASLTSAASLVLITLTYRTPTDAAPTSDRVNKLGSRPSAGVLLATSLAGCAWGLFNVGLVIFFSFAPPFLADQGMEEVRAASTISLTLWITMASVPLGGLFIQRMGFATAVMIVFPATAAIALTALVLFGSPIAVSITVGICMGGAASAIFALPTGVLTQETRAVGLGVFYMWYYGAMALGPAVAGLSRDMTDDAAMPLLIGATIFLATPFVVLGFRYSSHRLSPS